jgi:hypothetical protein
MTYKHTSCQFALPCHPETHPPLGARPAPRPKRHRLVPHRRARRRLRGVRHRAHHVQLLSQPSLPEVPACGAERWLAARHREILPIPYFHVAFTLPHALNPPAQVTRGSSIVCSFRAPPSRCCASGEIPYTSAATSVSPPCCTRGVKPLAACACPLRRDRRRAGAGRHALNLRPARVPVSRPRPGQALPRSLSRGPTARLRPWGGAPRRGPGPSRRACGLRCGAHHVSPLSLGRLRFASQAWFVYCKPPFAGPDHVLAYLRR